MTLASDKKRPIMTKLAATVPPNSKWWGLTLKTLGILIA
jgi:hypothetical protein